MGRSSYGKDGVHQPARQYQAHYGSMRIEDVLCGIEPEFSLCLDDSDGVESEDSLTCLVKDYEKRYSSDRTIR